MPVLPVLVCSFALIVCAGPRGGGAGQARAMISGGGRGHGANSNSGLKTERTQWLSLIDQLKQK